MLVADGVDDATLEPVLEALREDGAICELLAPHDGALQTAGGGEIAADRGMLTTASVLYDAVLVAGGDEAVDALQENGEAVHCASEAYKPVGAIGAGVRLLAHAPLYGACLAESPDDGLVDAAGVVTTMSNDDPQGFAEAFARAVAQHRHFDRDVASVPA